MFQLPPVWIFSALILITILSGAAALYLARRDNPSEQVNRLIETFANIWQWGFWVFVALLFGKLTFLQKLFSLV